MQSKYDTLPFLPATTIRPICPGITILHPLSRRGQGPGMIVLVPETGVTSNNSDLRIEHGVPAPIMKWAEEGYTVAEITRAALTSSSDALKVALRELEQTPTTVPRGVVGLVGRSFDAMPQGFGTSVMELSTYRVRD
jgi:carboxymethylenebutenolidase